MTVKDLFSSNKKYISRKNMRENFQHDPAFQKIAGDSRMAKIIGRPNEQRSLHRRMMKEARDGKISFDDMKKISQDLSSGKVEGISSTKGRSITKEFFPSGLKANINSEAKQTERHNDTAALGRKSTVPKKVTPQESKRVMPAYFVRRFKTAGSALKTKEAENKKASFFDAMRSVNRNKK